MTTTDFMLGALLNIPAHLLQERVLQAYIDANLLGLTPSNSVVFQRLSGSGDRITELARRANMTKQSMGYLVESLIGEGYLILLPDPIDKRAKIVCRTEKGWEVNRIARQTVEQVQIEWTQLLGDENMEQLLRLLHLLTDALGVFYAGSPAEASARRDTEPQSGE